MKTPQRKPKNHRGSCELLRASDSELIAGLTCSCPERKPRRREKKP